MDVELPDAIIAQAEDFERKLDGLRDRLQPFLSVNPKDLEEELTPLERAQWYTAVSRAAVTLFQLHCKAKGLDPGTTKGVQDERDRVLHYTKKVKRAVDTHELSISRPTISVNLAGAGRFIANALPDISKEQREALRKVATKPEVSSRRGQNEQSKPAAKGNPRFQKNRELTVKFLEEILADSQELGKSTSITTTTAAGPVVKKKKKSQKKKHHRKWKGKKR